MENNYWHFDKDLIKFGEYFPDFKNNLVPENLNKQIIVNELRMILNIIYSNLFFHNICLKINISRKNFLSPKLEKCLNFYEFKTSIVKELVEVKYL